MAQPQVLERIRHELIESGQDARYGLGAYEFVLNGLEFYLSQLGEKRHVSGQELSKSLLVFAHKQYGALARNVLKHWGVNGTADLGNLVYNMIALGIMNKQPEDRLEHFENVTDIDQFFAAQDSFEIDPAYIKKIKGA